MHERETQPTIPARPLTPASPWSRFGAAWLDGLVLKLISWFVLPFLCLEIADFLGLDTPEEYVYLVGMAFFLLFTLYFGIQLSSPMRGSFSHHLSKIEMRDAKSGRAPSLGQAYGWAILQAAFVPFDLIGSAILLLGYLPILSKPRHQSVLDRICGVIWVRTPSPRRPPAEKA